MQNTKRETEGWLVGV